jgi:hypothetical protein
MRHRHNPALEGVRLVMALCEMGIDSVEEVSEPLNHCVMSNGIDTN